MDNTEAVEKLAEIVYEASQYPDAYSTAAKAILAAIQAAPLAYVKPKPLEWKLEKPHEMWAVTSMNVFRIILWNEIEGYDRAGFETGGKGYSTLEAAQAAVETHRNEMLAKEFEQ